MNTAPAKPILLLVGTDQAVSDYVYRKGLQLRDWRHIRRREQAHGLRAPDYAAVFLHGWHQTQRNRDAAYMIDQREIPHECGDVPKQFAHLFPDNPTQNPTP